MYPNPQDVLPLPPRPDADQYRKRARDLARACQAGGDAVQAWATQWIAKLNQLQPASALPEPRDHARSAQQVADFARERVGSDCALTQAQFVIARAHGFASWTRLLRHIEAGVGATLVSAFEQAVEAIVGGDLERLEALLAANPGLVHARSDREHRATLLHYVAANGVENYRQRTPPNIVAIARRLLDAGAELDAVADVYGGGATTLGLAVTSAHPRRAGVQLALADLLLERGARVNQGIVRSCLMNGCPEAAAHLAARGEPLGLREACGIGRMDVVARAFEAAERPAPTEQAEALMMACWYDQQDIVRFLLDHGVDVTARDPDGGGTALHVAAYRGSAGLVELLIGRGAPVNVNDDRHGTPPLVWALHAWLVEGRGHVESYGAVLKRLAAAGARVREAWLDHDRLRAEPDLLALLRRQAEQA